MGATINSQLPTDNSSWEGFFFFPSFFLLVRKQVRLEMNKSHCSIWVTHQWSRGLLNSLFCSLDMSCSVWLHLLRHKTQKQSFARKRDSCPNTSCGFLTHYVAPGIDRDALSAIISLIYAHESIGQLKHVVSEAADCFKEKAQQNQDLYETLGSLEVHAAKIFWVGWHTLWLWTGRPSCGPSHSVPRWKHSWNLKKYSSF